MKPIPSNLENPIQTLDQLSERLANAKAVAAVANSSDFENYTPKIMHDYLGAIVNILVDAESLCERVILSANNQSSAATFVIREA